MYLLPENMKEDSYTLITSDNQALITGKPVVEEVPIVEGKAVSWSEMTDGSLDLFELLNQPTQKPYLQWTFR